MVISLVLLFIICLVSSFFEERFRQKDKIILYVLYGIAMVLIAGLREPGSTPDSNEYEMMLHGNSNDILEEVREPSFSLICSFVNSLSLGVNALFLTYATISIAIHLSILWKLSKEFPFTIITVYISYYFMMHEMVQIRAGVAAGLFLWAIYYYVNQKKLASLSCIFIGILFHYSAAIGLIIFLLNNNISNWQKYILYLVVPIGIMVYFANIDISYIVPDEFGGDRLIVYRKMRDMGNEDEMAGIRFERNPIIWLNIMLYYACIFFREHLTKCSKYVPIAIKLQAIGFCCLFFLKGFSMVVGNRLNDYFSIVSIILWTASVYAFYPQIMGKVISNLVSSARFVASVLIYALSLLSL